MTTRYDTYGWESPKLESVMSLIALRLGIRFKTWRNEDIGGTYYEWEGTQPP